MLAFSAVGTIAISSASKWIAGAADNHETAAVREKVENMDYRLGDGCRYSGYTLNGKPDGKGTVFRSNGNRAFEGTWDQGTLVEAKQYDANGHLIFDGGWIRTTQNTCNRNGCGTSFYWNDAKQESIKIYEGDWKNGQRQGHGTAFHWNDDAQQNLPIYEGEWLNHKRHGYGTSFYWNIDKKEKIIIYDGRWFNGQRQGYGTSYRADGTLYYIGDWANGKRSGKGVQYYPVDKSQTTSPTKEYDGEWSNGLTNGFGVRFFRSGRPSTVGTWHDGVATGAVIEYYDDEKHTVKFKGELKGEQPNGHCEMYWSNGPTACSGEMKHGRPNGQCDVYWDNGRLAYSGSWVGTVREGGKYYNPEKDGTEITEAQWLDFQKESPSHRGYKL